MRLLHVVQSYADTAGGGPRFVRELSTHLAQTGHRVDVWTTNAVAGEYSWDPTQEHVEPGSEMIDGVAVRRYAARHLPFHWRTARLLALLLPGRLKGFIDPPSPLVPGLWWPGITRRDHPDLIHGAVFPFDSLLWPVFLRARRLGIPFVLTPLLHFGRGEADAAEYRRFYRRRHQDEMLRGSAAIMTLGPTEREYAIEAGAAPERVVVLHLGIDPEAIADGNAARFREKYSVSGPLVLHVANKAVAKGSTHVIESMHRLWRAGSDASLVMLGGSTPCFREFIRKQHNLPPDRYHDLGYVSEADKRDALAAASLMAMPSRADALGIVYLEAWACGKPVVGARAGGVQDLIEDGVDGRLVEYGDVPTLSAAIQGLLADPVRAEAMGQLGRQKVLRRHTRERQLQTVDAVYQAVLEGRPPLSAVRGLDDEPPGLRRAPGEEPMVRPS